MKRKVVIALVSLISLTLVLSITILSIDGYVKSIGSKYIYAMENVPEADAVMVLGAYVYPDGRPSNMLEDRLNAGIELYSKKKAPKILVTGDHGRVNYDEVNSMKSYLMNKQVKNEDIFMDHAGFSTYESIYRARDIFEVKKLIIVTQEYHLMRAVYIARKMGIEAYGIPSVDFTYKGMRYYEFREMIARNKDFFFVHVLKPEPTFLGEAIPITGDGRLTNDKYSKD
ncbi:MAG: YdcF family protein [Desulfitobacterium hafniense]|nr:YdcF family protein [Desulfitobacterium hafniense]